MRKTLLLWSDRIIRYGIYAIFFLVPLFFTNNTSELFELNKMWLTWEITLFIAVAWIMKMILLGRIRIQRTPLDIPILLFLISQTIATIISLDPHTSFWGYYSRFNGGWLSLFTYIFLFYVVISNLEKKHIMTILKVSLASGLIVALWGLPAHFGHDPTCLLFQGSFDVSCWTDAFKPTVRIFSTLGQPAWMAAYLNVLLPITLTFFFLITTHFSQHIAKKHESLIFGLPLKNLMLALALFLLVLLFYADLIFTNTRAGMIAFWVANAFFWGIIFLKRYFPTKKAIAYFLLFNLLFLLFNFVYGTTFAQLDRFTLPALMAKQEVKNETPTTAAPTPQAPAESLSGTDSGTIRQIVWRGAIDVWKEHPLIGSGVETFAFAYYKHRPAAHNLTSEWDYLYNKAHNEYLNYLATTGIFGLGTYLAFIGLFLYLVLKHLLREKTISADSLLITALSAAFISILITNFFAFSVVIINLYLFLIPAFVFLFVPDMLPKKALTIPRHTEEHTSEEISAFQWIAITGISLIGAFFLILLIRFWYADKAYALGSNLNRVQEYQQSYLKLGEAVDLRPSEPTFKDEFATNNATIALLLMLGDGASTSAEAKQQAEALTQQAIALSNENVTKHPNNIQFWKNRVRIFYALAQADDQYLPDAVQAVERVRELAPTDAKVMYNLGALYRENNQPEKSAEVLKETIRLKPDYRDAYYALAVAYNDMAVNDAGHVIHPELREKAINNLQYILQNISAEDNETKQLLSSWDAL